MKLPLVDTFSPAYEIWETRDATLDEMLAAGDPYLRIPIRLEASISNAYNAATHMAKAGADNRLGNFINDALDNSVAYRSWRQAMPSKTPCELSRYQKLYPRCNFEQVSAEIEAVGRVLSEGQCLFHAGLWPTNDNHLLTERPLSTSFCPQVVLRNADYKGKGYDADRIDLFVLRATTPKTKVFAYRRKGTNLGHENEVVFAAGAGLSLRSAVPINTNYPAGKYGFPDKRILVRILEIDIS